MYTLQELLRDLHYINELALGLHNVDLVKLTEDQQDALRSSVFVVKYLLEQITYSLEHPTGS